jgi:hypothetical protein
MTDHHQHHHPAGQHPPATVAPSILRLSVAARVGYVSLLVAAIWAAVVWTMGS